ncbi:MAG: HipA N-terminal domain-containing protein [Bacteroidales bacterium]|jgi:serine/threonine-protein kinase HipA|nr:HipA N-terminal domain-containing protein [Bacteroidales bacterium]
MNRKGNVFYENRLCGIIEETETGYRFSYDVDYINDSNSKAISKTLPLSKSAYTSNTMFPFFDGLIPEGWLLDIAEKHWKIDERDRMGLLLTCCNDCIGAVSVKPIIKE